MHSWLLLFLLLSAWKGPQPRPEMMRLNEVLERMGENLERLPNYTCHETIDRSIRQTVKDKLLVRDRIHLQVAFIGFEEVFAWPGSANFEPRAAIQIAPGGAGGIGSWGGWSRNVLRSSAPAFTYAGECTVEGRRRGTRAIRGARARGGWEADSHRKAGREAVPIERRNPSILESVRQADGVQRSRD